MLAYVFGLIAGVFQPTQTSINTKLTDYDRSPFVTTLLTTPTAIILMFVIVLISEGSFYLPIDEIAEYPWWIWIGGLCGPVISILSIICLPVLGSAETMMLTAFGQIMAALVIDNWGMFMSPVIRFSWQRFMGAALVIAGVIIVAGRKEASKKGHSGGFYKVLAFIAGIACSVQVATNGTLGKAAGSAMRATFISMCFAMIGTVIFTLLILTVKGREGLYTEKVSSGDFKWWMATGGVAGVIIVGSNAIAAPVIGAGMVNILNLVGEMGGGLFFDSIGFLGIEQKPVTIKKISGVLLMIIGTILIS